jgi:hypothetical protein
VPKNTNEILWRFLADTKSLDRGSRKAKGDFKDVERSSDKMQQGLGVAAGALGALGLAFGAMEVKDFILETIEVGRVAIQTSESFDRVFGPAADRLRGNLEDTRKAMGLGVDEMEAMLLTTGALATGMGLNSIEAADMSEQLFVLAGDLQAFNPAAGSTEEALNALQAAIRGEFDPLERFGAKLSAAEINERALANTGKDTTAELTAQDKALATLELALEKTTIQVGALEDAEKDGRRETEKLTASVRDLRVEFGTKLAPIADDLTGALGNLTGSMGDASGRSFLLLDAIKVLTGGLEDNTEAFEGDAAEVDNFTEAVAGATDWLGKALGFIPPLSNKLHDQADAWRDDAREAGKASNAFQVASLNMVRIVDPAGKAANAIVGVGSAARLTASRLASLTSQAKATVNALRSVAAQQDITKAGPVLFATGGTVPGPRGAPQAAIVHGGEKVLTPGQQRDGGGGGGGGGPVTINVVAGISDPQAVAEAVAEAIRLYERTNGRIL